MLLIDFIITVFCWIDDMLKKISQGKKVRQRGPEPKLSDAEVMTMEVVGEFLGMDTDKGIHAYFYNHWKDLFPQIGDRSAFLRQSANLWAYKQQLHQMFVKQLVSVGHGIRIVDGFPMPVCNFKRAHFSKIFRPEADYGYCAAKNQNYYGFKGHLLIDENGVIVDVVVSAANKDEREAVFDMRESIVQHLLGDKGYIMNPLKKQELLQDGIVVHTPLRSNMMDTRNPQQVSMLNRVRRLIETVIGQLSERFHIEKIRARDLWHLTNRIARKILAHNVCQLITRSLGLGNLQFDRLTLL